VRVFIFAGSVQQLDPVGEMGPGFHCFGDQPRPIT
jgi:hypothetical protein